MSVKILAYFGELQLPFKQGKPMALQSQWIQGDRQRTCILDPILALSEYGIPLIHQLGNQMELWVVRELWNILDNSTVYLNQPELITPKGCASEVPHEQERSALESTLLSLKSWEKFRSETDLSGLKLFWLGDSPKESLLPQSRTVELFYRWEAIATTLDCQIDSISTRNYILPLAFRDTVALAMSLESTFILSCQSSTDFEQQHPPEICHTLQTWGILCQILPSDNAIVAKEREALYQLLIATDTAKYLWAGIHLIVVHLVTPPGFEHSRKLVNSYEETPNSAEDLAKVHKFACEMWKKTRAFWYLL